MKKMKVSLLFFGTCLLATNLHATTLKEVLSDVLETNPVIAERLKNYRATKEEIGVAEAGYYPTIDIQSSVGKKYNGRFSGDSINETYDVFQNSLVLKQNIFDGFSTHEQVNYQKMRTLAAAYSYLEKANDVALQTIKVYIDLLQEREMLTNSETNVERLTALYDKVSKAYKAGLTSLSEVAKIQSSLAIAQSNKLVQHNRLANAMFNFRRITGYLVEDKDLQKPIFSAPLPQNQDVASVYALEYNPSILVGKYNIKGAEALYRESRSKFMPKINLEMSENYNKNYNEFTGVDDRFQAMLVVSYNIFNGGADEATKRSKLSKISQEIALTDDLRRQVIEGMDLSWSAYDLAKDQMPFLMDYERLSKQTLELYTKEYQLGERSLLDLLATENDLKRANDELISAKYNLLISKYRIMDAMGLTMASIMGDVTHYYKKVGLRSLGARTQRDTLPEMLDKDGDGVSPTRDICAQSKRKNGVKTFGCSQSVQELESVRLQ